MVPGVLIVAGLGRQECLLCAGGVIEFARWVCFSGQIVVFSSMIWTGVWMSSSSLIPQPSSSCLG